MDKLIEEIYEELKTELGISEESDLSILKIKVKNAYKEVCVIRNYPKSYTEEFITGDMERFYSNIRGLALYDYNQIGVEGESSHNDNTGTRTWFSRNTYLEGVVAICTLI